MTGSVAGRRMRGRHTIRRIPGSLVRSPTGRLAAMGTNSHVLGSTQSPDGCPLVENCVDARLARSGGRGLIRGDPTLAAMDDNHTTTQYEIRVRGLLSDRLLSAFPEMRGRNREHETVLRGALPDQAALHGVLGRIEALGLELIEVRRARPRADARHRPSS